jgi:hypothetical protein
MFRKGFAVEAKLLLEGKEFSSGTDETFINTTGCAHQAKDYSSLV